MPSHAETLRLHLAKGPLNARQLIELMGISQPTISRALAELGDDIVRIGAARSIRYALRDSIRSLPQIPIYQVNVEGQIRQLGTLHPVRPEGFVMAQSDGATEHSDSLPWWLYDMRPQGYLGRAYANRHGAVLGLPTCLSDWSDTHALRALLARGHDLVGNLLLGDLARDRFLSSPPPEPIAEAQKPAAYAQLAQEAARGDLPGSSAGGEQPKFTAYSMTPDGPRHVLVKFSEVEANPVSERWRDLLLAEHLALETLRNAGLPAAKTRILDHGNQRFLEVERFDRIGALGRRAVISLAAFDAEFIGAGNAGWPTITSRLAAAGHIHPQAAEGSQRLWAFGTLIGNTDMHNGNLSFVSEHGRPYDLAPAYDITPMAFAPRSGGGMANTLTETNIHASVPNQTWRDALEIARAFVAKARGEREFSARFERCIAALEQHITLASSKIERLA